MLHTAWPCEILLLVFLREGRGGLKRLLAHPDIMIKFTQVDILFDS